MLVRVAMCGECVSGWVCRTPRNRFERLCKLRGDRAPVVFRLRNLSKRGSVVIGDCQRARNGTHDVGADIVEPELEVVNG